MAFTESVVSASALYAAKLLGYSELKELQMQVIVAFVMGQDVFVYVMHVFQYSWMTCIEIREKA